MLVHLAVNNYAIVDNLELDLGGGMSVITGETGAGKSIMLDALALTLGDRADSGLDLAAVPMATAKSARLGSSAFRFFPPSRSSLAPPG